MTESNAQNPSQANLNPAIERLAPYEVMDATGFSRRVFKFGEHDLVFKGREELPVIPGFEDAVLAGAEERPRFSTSSMESGTDPSKIVANQTPLGVIEAGIALDIATEKLSVLRDEILQGTYSDETLSIIDDIMTCRLFNREGKLSEHADRDAEAIVLLALSGDQEAIQEVETRKAGQRVYDEAVLAASKNGDSEPEGEVLDPDNVLLVRRTNYVPEVGEDGIVRLRSTADLTHGSYVRPSLHFSLDVPVVSHMQGNWDGVKYTIVDTLGSVLERRKRPPTNLANNDTWFEQNPGEVLELPTAKIFIADEGLQGEPTEDGQTVTYNPHTVSISNLVASERTKRGIESPGRGVTEHGWAIESPKNQKLNALASKLGVGQKGHFYTAPISLEHRLGSQISLGSEGIDPEERTKGLFEGTLEVDWTKMGSDYEFVDEDGNPAGSYELELPDKGVPGWFNPGDQSQPHGSLNGILFGCSTEVRRNFYASGLSIPRVTVIQGRRKEISDWG